MPDSRSASSRTSLLVICAAMVLSLLAAPAASAGAVQAERISGPSRVETAIELAHRSHPQGAATVLLARADGYADALAGGPLAHELGAPILLTGPVLSEPVRSALERLGAERVVLLGGTSALPGSLADELVERGFDVDRIAGDDRFETAAMIAERLDAGVDEVFLTEGAHADPSRGWPDALAASSVASRMGAPVLLTAADALPEPTTGTLDKGSAARITIVGGTSSVSAQVADGLRGLGFDVRRVAGQNRYETGVAAADLVAESDVRSAWIATGTSYADALVAAPAVAGSDGVLLLTDGQTLAQDDPAVEWLMANGGGLESVIAVGGTNAISDAVLAALESAANGRLPSAVVPGTSPTGSSGQPADPSAQPADPSALAGDEVLLPLGQDLQAVVDEHPPGTTFVLQAGTHRTQAIVARDGDRFIGQSGAVMSGARVLPQEDFVRASNGTWYVEGQTQEGFIQGLDAAEGDRDAHPEELFVDYTNRLDHVGSIDHLRPGAWFFDYEADRIYLHDDPASFAQIETSLTPFAIGGMAVRDVLVENIIFEKYATPSQRGPVGGAVGLDRTLDWTVRNVTSRYNHGGGITVGPGMTIEGSEVHHNGQIGLAGSGTDEQLDYSAPITVARNRIHHNNTLGFYWEWEAGATKFKRVDGMVFEHNWVHDNHGPGAWWDMYNQDLVVRSNLVEDNDAVGIFYELSYGPAVIHDNIVRNNGRDASMSYHRTGIQVFNSEHVLIENNLVTGQPIGVRLNHSERGVDLSDIVVRGNQISMEEFTGIQSATGEDEVFTGRGNVFEGNDYYLQSSDARVFAIDNSRWTASQWQSLFEMDRNGTFSTDEPPTELPSGSQPFVMQDRYGAR